MSGSGGGDPLYYDLKQQLRDKLFIKTVSGGSPELIINLLPCALCWQRGHSVFNCPLILTVDVRGVMNRRGDTYVDDIK